MALYPPLPPSTPKRACSQASLAKDWRFLTPSNIGVRPKLTFRESEELIIYFSIYSYKRHGCVSWNVTFHLTRC